MRVDLGGHSLAYALTGAGEPVITMIHGLASSKETFEEAARQLGGRARVLRIDLRGHGASDAPEGPWTLADLGADVIAVLDALGIAKTILVGHSAGGAIALSVALRYPDRVAGLVVASSASQANERAARFYEDIARKAEEHGAASVMRDLGWDADAPLPDATGFANAARCMATLHPTPLTPGLASIRCPVAILVGSEDFLGAGGSVIMSRAIGGSRLEIVEGRGHLIHLEEPAIFARLVEETALRA